MDLRSGVKIYDNDWFLCYRWSPERLADYLASLNVTYVIAQSRYLPMADSAVQSAVGADARERYDQLDDVLVRELLRERGIGYVAVKNICFDPAYALAHPERLPIDQWGNRHAQTDWYVGVPPNRADNIAAKGDELRRAVKALDPDGVHLGFIRWPGFWETWLPGDQRSAKPEYCFAPETIADFNRFAGTALEPNDFGSARDALTGPFKNAFTRYKCLKTLQAIETLGTAFQPEDRHIPISINTVPLFADDFDKAISEVFGQDVEILGSAVDVFEVMAYHQIMGQDEAWPARITSDIKARSGKKAICTVQASALYLDGMHKGKGRAQSLDARAFSQMLDRLEDAHIDGLCLFTLTELMDRLDTESGKAIEARLKRFRR